MLSESVLFDRDGMETMLVMGGSANGVYTNTVEARITDSPSGEWAADDTLVLPEK